MSHLNNHDFFPNLRFLTLQKYAKAWMSLTKEMGFPEHGFSLKCIRLFDATPIVGNQSHPKGGKENPVTDFEYFSKRYIVTFEFPDFENSQDMPQDNNAFEFARKTLEFNLKFPEPTLWRNSSFREIYKAKPDDNWLNEWVFRVGMPEGVDEEFCWVLYDSAGLQMSDVSEDSKTCEKGKNNPKKKEGPGRNKRPLGSAQAAVRQYNTKYHDERLSVEQFCDKQFGKNPIPRRARTLHAVKNLSNKWVHTIPISTLRRWIASKYKAAEKKNNLQ